MSATIDVLKVAPEAMTPLRDITKGVAGSGLEASLLELVRMRASQINGAVSASPFITVKGGSWAKATTDSSVFPHSARQAGIRPASVPRSNGPRR